MLPLLYPEPATREALLADPATAPIPPLHRELFRFAEKFVRSSWTMTPDDLQRLRDAGLTEAEIVRWATLGSTQTWFTMNADGGGVPLEGGAPTGAAVGRSRESYEAAAEGLLAAAPGSPGETGRTPDDTAGERIAWVESDESAPGYRETADWAERRYGFAPNLLRALSLQPGFYRRHRLALELLESPQSGSLSPRHHAMIRVRVSELNRCRYSEPTSRTLLARVAGGAGEADLVERLRREPLDSEWSPLDHTILALATKFARNTYKVTAKDAAALREVGGDDATYVDILNTVSIQTSLDRLANALGVRPDPLPLLPRT